MITNLYSIKDNLTGYLSILSDENDASAIRNFEHAIAQKNNLFYSHASDYELYHIGTFNSENGEIVPCEKRFLISGLTAKGNVE